MKNSRRSWYLYAVLTVWGLCLLMQFVAWIATGGSR